MKFIVIGLGNFGSSLAINLTRQGHEVIGLDFNMNKVENFKNKITHTIMINARDLNALQSVPIKEADTVIVCIGEDFGASVEVTANIKNVGAKKLISRAISPVQQTILEAIGVDEIIHPEKESAERMARRLELKGVLDSFDVAEDYKIIEAEVPERFIGKTVEEVDLRKNYKINIITILKQEKRKNPLGADKNKERVIGVVSPLRPFEENDVLVIFGALEDIDKMLEL